MTAARWWRLLPLVLLAVGVMRLWLGGSPRLSEPMAGFGLSTGSWAERLPSAPQQVAQEPWLTSVLASPAWGGSPMAAEALASMPQSQAQASSSAAADVGWTFLGTYFDGFTRRALVLYDGDDVLELETGDVMPSGEIIRLILEDEILVRGPQEGQPAITVRVGRSSEKPL